MGIKTEQIPVYPVTVFNAANDAFWLSDINSILERYAFLEAPHRHSFYTLLFIEKASGSILIDQESIRLDEAKIICIKPNSVISIDINRTARGSMLCFTESFFSLRYNNNVLSQFSFLQKEAEVFARLNANEAVYWKNLLQLMHTEATEARQGFEKVIRSFINILLFNLDRKLRQHSYAEKISNKEEKVVQFELLIEDNFLQHKTPSWYACQLNITANYLNKLCNDYRQATSGDLIRKRVIIEAQRLLHYTSLTVAEIAYRLGFETPSYFITFFKKNTQTTPEHFRKKTT